MAPYNVTLDILLGSNATSSAKMAFINMAGGTPTATISANSGNNATFLTGLGNLGTTNMQNLTLGGGTTGTLLFQPNADTGDYMTLSSSGTDLTLATTDSSNLTISPSGNLVLDSTGGTIDINDATIDLATQATNIDIIGTNTAALTFESGLLRLDTQNTAVEVTGTTNLGDGGTTNYAQFNATGDLTFVGSADTITVLQEQPSQLQPVPEDPLI